eukprot:1795807-Karenia_brevis.AAC.1
MERHLGCPKAEQDDSLAMVVSPRVEDFVAEIDTWKICQMDWGTNHHHSRWDCGIYAGKVSGGGGRG